ncbi:MAG: metal ABC transporter substrate-binding protein [Actinomycetia bacterium]|nr:metal ABC transporter substrate-binding protein [Actinomycetes bacterium]
MRNKGLIVSAGCGLALLVSGCTSASDTSSSSSDRTVVATTTILGSVAEQVTDCAGGTVTTLMPRGVDPHDYSPSSSDVVTMVGADLVVANGLGLEEGLASALENAAEDGANVYEVAPNVDPLPFSEEPESHEAAHEDEEAGHSDEADHEGDEHEGEKHSEDEADHDHGDLDPHVWMDTARMAQAAELIGGQLADATGDENYRNCGSEAAASLQETNQQVTSAMADIPQKDRKLVTDHDSLGYFAAAYDFEVEGVVIPGGSTLGQPDSAELATLAKLIKDEKIPAIFVSEGASPALADALAAEVGEEVQVVTLYVGSVGPEGSDAATYQGMMTSNARTVAGALTS